MIEKADFEAFSADLDSAIISVIVSKIHQNIRDSALCCCFIYHL